MALVTLKPILEDAKKRGYAIGSFNMVSLETVRGAIKAAEELNSPIILQLAEVHTKVVPIEFMAPIMIEAAKKAKIPVCVHFDHGNSYESIVKAIKHGFSSVMFDGASNPFDENVRLTKEISKLAHSMGVTLEAELGQVRGADGGNGPVEITLTDVKEAIKFVKETEVDALAVSIGNLHGEYKEPPVLRFDRLKDISSAVDIPLVLHGGTGTGAEGFKKCIKNGIHKINIGTAILTSSVNGVRRAVEKSFKNVSYFSIIDSIIDGTYQAVKEHIHIFGSANKA
jgi:fructose-bisphosphate aldolase class II